MSDDTYNGWSNYATWRVQLELLDDYCFNGGTDQDFTAMETSEVAEILKDYVDEALTDFGQLDENSGTAVGSLALSYAQAFVSDVNWWECATHAQEADAS